MCALCELAGVDLHKSDADGSGTGLTTSDAPPVFSLSQIIQQLRTQWGGIEGATVSWPGSGPISYYIGGNPYPSGSSEIPYTTAMTPLMQSRAVLAFELWDDLIARDLTQSATATDSQIQAEYATQTDGGGTYSGLWGYGTGTGPYGTQNYAITRSEIWFNSNWTSHDQDADMYFGGYGFQTYIHEIGHSLGLSHPGSYNAGSGGVITYANSAEFAQDNRQYTVMSYFGGYALGAGWQQDGTYSNWYYSSTPMLYDVAAIQAVYGADMTTRTTDTVYGFNCNLAANDPRKAIFDFSQNSLPIFTIWDAGGIDALDCSGYGGGQTIDLRAGSYSSVNGLINNIAIAFNCTIENAVGGNGSDVITGNSANNVLTGRGGNDLIDGGGGIDTAVFSGFRSAYAITMLDATTLRVVGADGTDTLTNIEFLQFDDQVVALGPEIAVSGNGFDIADGDTTPSSSDGTDFGSVLTGATVDHVFTVSNTGTATLTTSGLTLPSGFILVEGLSGSIAPGASDTFTVRLDTSTPGTKSGQITFTDNDSDESPFNFTVTGTVTAINPPVITSLGGGTSATVAIAENTATVATVTASASDPGTVLTFSLDGGADQARFQINAATGVLSFINAPDFEAPGSAAGTNSYVVQVRVTDSRSSSLSDTQTITVNVSDTNDVAPLITTPATLSVSENRSLVTLLTSYDPDTVGIKPATFSIVGGADAAKFTIVDNSLVFVAPPDFEVPTDSDRNNSYVVQVQASDGTNTATQTITVDVTDVNDLIGTGQTLTVGSGQTVSDVAVVSGGKLNVLSGGVAYATAVRNGGAEVVWSGGATTATVVSAGGAQTVYSGGVASGTTVQSGGREINYGTLLGGSVGSAAEAYVGGVATGTRVFGGGSMVVWAGGQVRGAILSGGAMEVQSGGVASGTVASSGGRLYLYSGSVASGTVAASGGQENVFAGAIASGTTVLNGGVVTDYGTLLGGTVNSGGAAYIGGVATGTTVVAGGGIVALAGGTVSTARITGGLMEVQSGGVARDTVASSGGRVLIYSGGMASGTTVSSGGRETVFSGGTASGTIVSAGGSEFVQGRLVGGTVGTAGEVYVAGTASGTTVVGGGSIIALSGGVIAGAALTGGFMEVQAGGMASGTAMSNGARLYVYAGGAISGTTISSGAQERVFSGAVAHATSISSGGQEVVYAGGVASGTTVMNGGLQVDYGTLVGGMIASGGQIYVSGVASSTTVIAGGNLVAWSGGLVSGAALSGGMLEIQNGADARGTTVFSGGRVFLYSGGVESGTTVSRGGGETVFAGGVASGTTVTAGGVQTVFGTLVGGVVASAGEVYVGGTASGTAVTAGGDIIALSGGLITGAILSGGGMMEIRSGGTASGTVVSSGARVFLYAGGSASGTLVSNGGLDLIDGRAVGEMVFAGGRAVVQSGGIVSGATVSGGVLEIRSGGTAGTSTIAFTGTGGTLKLYDSQNFGGKVAGFGVPGRIDFADIAFGANTTLGFSQAADNTSGTLTVSDGVRTASITLLGQYAAGNFIKQNDGSGGTLITDVTFVAQNSLFNPHG